MNRRSFLQTSAGASLGSAMIVHGQTGSRIKIGQIGVKHSHAAGKMDVYRENAEYEVVGIVEPDDAAWARAEKSATYQGLKRMSVEELLNVPGLQAVAVETEIKDLLRQAELCVDAGKHVHLDKPAGESLADYRRLMEKADAKNLTVQMGYMFRFNPAVLMLREFLAQGWLGEVFETHAVISKVVGRADREDLLPYPGGILFELGCHVIDLTIGVLGKPQNVTPFARKGADGLADNMLAVLDYPKAVASVKSSGIEVDGGSRRHFVVCGTEGTFHIQPLDRPAVRLSLSQDRGAYKKGTREIPFEPPYRRYVGDAIDLAKIIRGEKKSEYPSAHDLAVQETVLRASGLPVA